MKNNFSRAVGAVLGSVSLLLSAGALAQVDPPEVLADVNSFGSANPTGFVTVGEKTYFVATTDATGDEPETELWVYDGDGAPTKIDINTATTCETDNDIDLDLVDEDPLNAPDVPNTAPDSYDANDPCGSDPQSLTVVGDLLYFTAIDPAGASTGAPGNPNEAQTVGRELYVLDTTNDTFALVENINGSSASSSVANLIAFDDMLFFTANDGTNGNELWVSADGTGADMVVDLNGGFASSNPSSIVVFDGALFFAATDGSNVGEELYTSDGTDVGTVLVADINPNTGSGSKGSSPQNLTVGGTTLFFTALNSASNFDGGAGRELWKSDGTLAGTVLVADIHPNDAETNASQNGSSPSNLVWTGTQLVFLADDGDDNNVMYSSTGSGATKVTGDFENASDLTVVDGDVFFAANDTTGENLGNELFLYTGSGDATLVRDINDGGSSSPSNLVAVDGILLFAANDGDNGNVLWASDGTAGGTVLLADTDSGNPAEMTVLGDDSGRIIYAADTDGVGRDPVVTSYNIAFIDPLSVNEGTGTGTTTFTFTVRLLLPADGTVTVDYSTLTPVDGDAVEGADCTLDATDFVTKTATTLTFNDGQTTPTTAATVLVCQDGVLEGDETFSILLESDDVVVASGTGAATIVNDESVPSVTFAAGTSQFTEPEANGAEDDHEVTVTLSAAQTEDVTVNYIVTGDSTAQQGNDYAGLNGSVVIPAGETSAVIEINMKGDSDEEGEETLILTITSATAPIGEGGADVPLDLGGTLTHTVTLVDEDVPVGPGNGGGGGGGGGGGSSGALNPLALLALLGFSLAALRRRRGA